MSHTSKRETISVSGKLKELITIHDAEGNVLHKVLRPLMLDFNAHDAVQVIVGATLLAIPVGLTEEVWQLGETLSNIRIGFLAFFSLLFIAGFTYYVSYRRHIKTHRPEFVQRLLGTYILSLIVAIIFLFIIDKAPITTDFVLTLKRAIIIAFPASLSAAVVDLIK
jgi:uncharacterized membrane protein